MGRLKKIKELFSKDNYSIRDWLKSRDWVTIAVLGMMTTLCIYGAVIGDVYYTTIAAILGGFHMSTQSYIAAQNEKLTNVVIKGQEQAIIELSRKLVEKKK